MLPWPGPWMRWLLCGEVAEGGAMDMGVGVLGWVWA